MALLRVQQDLAEIADSQHIDGQVEPVERVMGGEFLWHGALLGPPLTPYEGGVFRLSIRFPQDYPYNPPNVNFTTKIFHCNISPDGLIGLDVLRSGWRPSTTLAQALSAVAALLATPEPGHALVPEVAALYLADRGRHDAMAEAAHGSLLLPE
eukprot:CAMPEP_0179105264 /NCGR_PEP_ID=MMETSP0796-20121207/48880_1 /TAXON_ID=73915 /ORGANISM="Pyrodinium bahamense, Strain pbaha01" /LENGTH=152 /DNA_ID=CAMNT_0020803249 /DNA_START=59 /DNA_END=515 /DNA_ORIENTATION=-